MKKIILIFILITVSYSFLYSQNAQKRLAVLPFTGGGTGEGDAIAILFSQEREIMNAFTVLPRTAALTAVFEEHRFQLDGLTDSDTIAGIGHILNADYVLSGNVRRLGNQNLLVATIIHVESFELVAGYYRSFTNLGEVGGFLSSMSREMVAAVNRNVSRLQRLAIIPFSPATNAAVGMHEADTLAQMLSIDILNAGTYVILPRTSTVQTALNEMNFQMQGHTSDAGVVAVGRAINADLVLSGTVLKLGNLNKFNAQILNVTDGSLLTGEDVDYQIISDALFLIPRLAILLTVPPGREREKMLTKYPLPTSRQSRQLSDPDVYDVEPRKSLFSETAKQNARRNVGDVFLHLSFSEDDDGERRTLFGIGAGVSWSPVSFMAIGLDAKVTFFTGDENVYGIKDNKETLWTAAPYIGIVIPVANQIRIFSNGFIEMGKLDKWHTGLIADWATPGFNVGLDYKMLYNINVKYRGLILKGKFIHGFSVGIGMNF